EIGTVADLQVTSADTTLVLVLYAVEQAHDVRTAPARLGAETQVPAALRLHYLVTATTRDAGVAQATLSRVLEVFHDHPVFTEHEIDAAISSRIGRLTIQLGSPTLEDLSNLWTALGTPMQLSLSYEVNAQPT